MKQEALKQEKYGLSWVSWPTLHMYLGGFDLGYKA